MNTVGKENRKGARLGSNKPRLPKPYVCVDPPLTATVFGFLKGRHQEQKENVLIHLRLCLHCREAVTDWLRLNDYLEPDADDSFHEDEPEVVRAAADADTRGAGESGENELYARQEDEGEAEVVA